MDELREELAYVRYPAIHGDQVAFVAEDDLWTVSAAGGTARRLSAGVGPFAGPRFTPDGTRLVFVGREEGEADLYWMPAGGGSVHRVTFTGGVVAVAGFTPLGRPVAAVNAKLPFPQAPLLYTVDLDGGQVDPLPWGTARAITYGPQGGVVLGRKTQDLATWKRYRGGTAGELWIDPDGRGHFHLFQAPDHGNLTSPMWVGERIYFLSDYQGVGNLYSIRPDGADLRRHTDHTEYYARNASTDGRRIVYHAGGDLWCFTPGDAEPERVPVSLASQRRDRERRYVEPANFLTEFAPHPDAEQLLVTTRGQLFQLGPFEGPVRQLSPGSGVRYRLARWVDKDRVALVGDPAGDDRVLMIHPEGGQAPEVLWDENLGLIVGLEVSQDGRHLALTNQRQELWLVDIGAKHAERIDQSPYGQPAHLAWSPDSRYLAYAVPLSESTTGIRVFDTKDGQVHAATRPVVHDDHPVWDAEGRYLYFLGARALDPVYDQVTFDMGFPRAVRPYLVTLQRDTPSPFVGPPAKAAKKPDGDAAAKKADQEPKPTGPVVIDFEGMDRRVVPFPVDESQFGQIASLGSKVLWTTFPLRGQRSTPPMGGDPPADGTLTVYDLTTREAETLVKGVTRFALAQNREHLVYQAGRKLRWVKAQEKVPDAATEAPGRKSGYLDWSRMPVLVNPPAEWAQMLSESWRMMLHRFWNHTMSDVDWDGMHRRYAALLPRLATRGDLSDVLWEMHGELGTSHAYESGGDYRPTPSFAHGFLGADFAWDEQEGGWRITHIVQGDPSVAGHDSPLNAPGVNVAEGDVLTAVDGRTASRILTPEHLLMRRREQEVALTVRRPHAPPRTVVVKALATEQLARYREWVEANRAWVHREGGGRVGYLHIPNMMAWGFSEFYRLYPEEVTHDALIVDVRFNGGGHVSQLLLEKLNRRPIGFTIPRWRAAGTYPHDAPRGPVVALTNDWAGSDGDIFSHSFKLMGLGPLVGHRTWGGVIGINPQYRLVDNTMVTQPEFPFWFTDVGWGVENYGTDPTIEVDYTPEDYAAGRDPQLETSLAEALALLEQHSAVAVPNDPKPSRAVPPLPPR